MAWSLRTKYIMTFVVFYGSFALAIPFLFLSPAVIDFSNTFDTTVDQVSIVFTVITVSYIFGSLICGILCKYIKRQIIVIVITIVQTVGLILTPFSPNLLTFFIINSVLGFTYGGCDSTLIAWMLEIWRNEAGPFIMAQNFAFGLGTFIPPLILEPFLTHKIQDGQNFNETTTTATTTTMNPIWPSQPENQTTIPKQSNLVTPFAIGASMVGLAAIMQIFLYFYLVNEQNCVEEEEREALLSKDSKKNSPDQEKPLTTDEQNELDKKARMRTVTLVLLSCLIIGFYQASELSSMQFLPTFSVYSKALSLSEAQAAQILFAMTITFAVTRGVSIFIAMKVSAELMLVANFIFMLIANGILLFFAQESLIALWTAAIVLGIGLSTVFPCYYAFIEKHLHISDLISSILLVFGGIVSSIYPIVIGHAVERNPSILCYVNFMSIGASTVAFALSYYLTVIKG